MAFAHAMTPDAAPASPDAHLRRRYEAIVLVGNAAVAGPGTGAAIAELCDRGAFVALIATAPLAELHWIPTPWDGPGALLLAATGGAGTDADGGHLQSRLDGDRIVVADDTVVDAMEWVVAELWRSGVGASDVLVVVATSAMSRDDWQRLLLAGADGVTVVSIANGGAEPPPGINDLGGGGPGLERLLLDQLRLRGEGAVASVTPEPGWGLAVDGFDPDHERVQDALLNLSDGRIGTSGAPLGRHPSTHPWVLAAGVYVGEKAETHLLTGPVASRFDFDIEPGAPLRRSLDLRTGTLREELSAGTASVESVRFSSLARPGTVVLRARCAPSVDPGPVLQPPADDAVHDEGLATQGSWMRAGGTPGGIVAAAAQTTVGDGVIDRMAVYDADPEALPDPSPALQRLATVKAAGFDCLLAEHRRAWAARWADADVVVEGDDELQLATRFALFHLMASAADDGEAPVGARGLAGTGYRGHVFWDADTFVVPFLAATHPAAARAMLEYRVRRLPAALEAARARGLSGARFPWESAGTGADVTPTSARDRSGQLVPIRTGLLEEHIVAEVPWAACCYVDWTGDEEFARGPGVRILAETARYWASRIRVDSDGIGHIYGVVGPDEYHEPVDDSAFTNVMARWNLRRAAAAVADGDAGCDVTAAERSQWLELATGLADGYDPDTGIYEEFAGFDRLEPLIIEEVAPRRPIAADLLLGADRVRGAQVVKQADVLMLHHLVPEEVAPGSLEPNLRYYEPRTAHGSSLSPAIHASLLARVRDFDHALEALRIASRIDLDDLTGTTSGGLHIAAMGGLWQALAFGFGGLRPTPSGLTIDPRLPRTWGALELRVRYRGSRVRIRKEHAHLSVVADRAAPIVLDGIFYTPGPAGLQFRRRGTSWEVET